MTPTKPTNTKSTKRSNRLLIFKVSMFWILLASTVVAFVLWGQYNYNKGVFEGISKTQSILQSK